MSDLATTLDAQGHFDEACVYVQRASDLARQIEHPELHMLLSNLAAILMHRGRSYEILTDLLYRGVLLDLDKSVKWCLGGQVAVRKLHN